MKKITVPQMLKRNICDIHGEKGKIWLEHLPQLLNKFQNLWQLNLLEPLSDLTYNLVLHAQQRDTGQRLIFKAGVPCKGFNSEISTLKFFAGDGCIRLLQYVADDGVMLLEEAIPGITLATYTRSGQDHAAVQICAGVIQNLHAKQLLGGLSLPPAVSLRERFSDFAGIANEIARMSIKFDGRLLRRAEEEYAALLTSTKQQILLHGDLHHYNILSATRQDWLAIDPQGVIGDPAFEVAAFMRNPFPGLTSMPKVKSMLRERLDHFAELLPYDKRRIWGWAFAQTILTAGWVLQDHGAGWEEWYTTAKLLADLEPI